MLKFSKILGSQARRTFQSFNINTVGTLRHDSAHPRGVLSTVYTLTLVTIHPINTCTIRSSTFPLLTNSCRRTHQLPYPHLSVSSVAPIALIAPGLLFFAFRWVKPASSIKTQSRIRSTFHRHTTLTPLFPPGRPRASASINFVVAIPLNLPSFLPSLLRFPLLFLPTSTTFDTNLKSPSLCRVSSTLFNLLLIRLLFFIPGPSKVFEFAFSPSGTHY